MNYLVPAGILNKHLCKELCSSVTKKHPLHYLIFTVTNQLCFNFRTFLESEVKNPVQRKDLYEKMVSLDPDSPSDSEREQQAITKLRYMQVYINYIDIWFVLSCLPTQFCSLSIT